jgi:hypothetical protein
MSVGQRTHLLLAMGYTLEQIGAGTLDAQTVRRDRSETLNRKNLDRFQFVVGSVARKVKRVVRLQPKIKGALSA